MSRAPFVRPASARRSADRRRPRLQVKELEDRSVPTAVALLAAELPEFTDDVRLKLEGTGQFTSVTAIDVAFQPPPTLAELESYDAVLVWGDFPFSDPFALGDTLADYVDAGHGVVTSVFANTFFTPLAGRWADDGYDPIVPFDVNAFFPLTLGTVAQPGHPIMAGVTDFSGGFASWNATGPLSAGTSLIASWSDGAPLVVEKSNVNVGLNMFPVSSDIYFDGWDSSTQGALLMANALSYVSGFAAKAVSPTAGEVVATPPTDFVIGFSADYDPTSVQPGDLTVNGIPADSVDFTGSDTLTFHYAASPVTAQGLQNIHMAAGAVDPLAGGDPVRELTASFRYDALLLQVTATAPTPGSTVTLPMTTLDLTFNEPYALSSVAPADFGLTQGSVTGITQTGDTTLRLTLGGVVAEGTLTLDIAAGALTDTFGNPGAAFTADYTLDFGTFPYPTPLTPVAPGGAIIFTGSQVGIIDPAGDTDNFTILVDPGQKITLTVDPAAGLQPVVELYRVDAGGNTLLGSAAAGVAGQEAVLQTTAAHGQIGVMGPGPKTYLVTVRGAAGTTGGYTVRMLVSAAVEGESHDGPTNNGRATAQSLEPSFLSFNASVGSSQSGSYPGRGAVLGTLEAATLNVIDSDDFESGALNGQWTTFSSQPQGRIRVTDEVGAAGGDLALLMDRNPPGVNTLNEAVWTVDLSGQTEALLRFAHTDVGDEENPLPLNFVGHANGDGVAISADGVNWRRVLNATNVPFGTWQTVSIDLAAEAAAAGMTLGAGFQIKFQQFDNFPILSDGRAYDQIVVGVPVKAQDYYSLSLRAGETVTVGLKGTADVELQNAAGVTVATAGGAANVNKVISDFVVPATGTYYARLSSGSFSPSDYALVVTRNAGFDTEANSTLPTAQNLSAPQVAGQQWALGHATGAVSPLDLPGTPVTGSLVLTSDKIRLGIQSDGSFIVGPTGIQFLGNEFVAPGTPLAGFVIGRDGENFVNKGAIGFTMIPVALEDLSTGSLHGVRAVGIVGGNLRLERVVVFRDGDEFATIATRLTNIGGAPLADVAWLENLDPDQGEPLGAGFGTFNDVVLGGELVRGHAVTGAFPDGLAIGLGSSDPRRVVSAEGFDNNDPFEIINSPDDPDGGFDDIAINMAFNFGTLAPSQSVSGTGIMTFGRSPGQAEGTYSTNRGGTAQEDRDFYRVQVDSNKTLAVQTIVPGRRAGEVVNPLDPMVRIYSPSGALVASDDNSATDGLNAKVSYKVPRGAGGVYFIEVLASPATATPTGGEYILTVKGASAPPAGGPLRAAGLPDGNSTTRKLTVAAARTLLPEAVRAWRMAGYDTSALGRLNIRVLDLGGDTLARASGNTIWLDDNAAGFGWFVDRTWRTDSEFLRAGNQGEQGRMDLLTVLIHEVGHLLGLGHAVDGTMLDELATGVRRRPGTGVW